MSVPNATLWVGLVCIGVLGCGGRSDVYCSRGECSNDGASGFGGGSTGGGLVGGDVEAPDREQTFDPPDLTPPPTMEMRPDEDLPVSGGRDGSFCPNGRIALASVVIEAARDLERLRGCEEIDGDLTLQGFLAADLSALSSLRQVKGTLHIQASAELVGLEALQQVWSLTLDNLQAPSLAPLQSLWLIGRFEGDESGVLEIQNTSGVHDLSGLSSLRSVKQVSITGNRDLVSLRGLALPNELDELVVRSNQLLEDLGNPSLRSAQRVVLDSNREVRVLTGLALLEEASVLTIDGLGVRSLDGLQALRKAEDVSIRDNDQLLDVTRLASVEFLSLALARNPVLASLPEFNGQAELQQVQIRDNSALTTGPRFPNVVSASRIMVARNPLLTRLDGFPRLTRVGTLEVRENASLSALELGALGAYDVARIVCNVALAESSIVPDLTTLGDRLELRGNLGSEPCP